MISLKLVAFLRPLAAESTIVQFIATDRVVELGELPLDAFSEGAAALFPVQLQCLWPHRASPIVSSEGDMGLTHAFEGIHDL